MRAFLARRTVEGWRLFQCHRLDITLLDINMPDGDGIRLLKKIDEVGSLRYQCF